MNFSKLGKRSSAFSLALAFILIIFSVVFVKAQSGTSSINGTVIDSQGSVVAGATVRLTSSERNFSRTAQTTSSGTFSFPSIPIGTYQIEVEANGFKKSVQKDIRSERY